MSAVSVAVAMWAVAGNGQRAHAQLWTFDDVVGHRERGGLRDAGLCGAGRRIVGDDRLRRAGFGRYFHLRETIALIDALERVDIGQDQRLAVNSMAVQNARGVDIEQVHQRGRIKVMIAFDGDLLYVTSWAKPDREKNVDEIGARRLGLMIDLSVKVTKALKIVAQAAIAFVEQVLVHAALFKDGDEMLDAIRFNGSALDFDLDYGAAIGGKAIVDRLGRGVVLRGLELDVGFKPALLLELAEYAIEGVIDGIVVDMSANAQPCVAAECIEAHAGVACDRYRAHARPYSRDHAKSDVGELLIGVGRYGLRDRRTEITVLLERGAHLIHGA